MAARGGLGRFMQSVVRFGWALYAGTRNISVLSTGVRGDRLYFIRLMRVRGMDMSRSRVSGSRLIAGAIQQISRSPIHHLAAEIGPRGYFCAYHCQSLMIWPSDGVP